MAYAYKRGTRWWVGWRDHDETLQRRSTACTSMREARSFAQTLESNAAVWRRLNTEVFGQMSDRLGRGR